MGPAAVSIQAWEARDFDSFARGFMQDAGWAEGGLATLAIFMVLTSILNRDLIYIAFAAWLIISARVGANSAGWDVDWFGYAIPEMYLYTVRKIIFTMYVALTAFLFMRLFRRELMRMGHTAALRTLELAYLPMLATPFLPYATFITLLWTCAIVGCSLIVYLLARILKTSRSPIAMLFGAAMAINMVAAYAEIIRAMIGLHGSLAYINSVTAAICSGLFIAIALVVQMRSERSGRVSAESSLQNAYNQVPVAFFTTDTTGLILRGNRAFGDLAGSTLSSPDLKWRQTFEKGGARWQQFFGESGWASLQEAVAGTPGATKRFQSDGSWFEIHASTNAKSHTIDGSIANISDVVNAENRLMYLADHDELTGALSRRATEQALCDCAATVSPESPAVLVYVDLKRFKSINDMFGHAAGDSVLRELCAHIRGRLGPDTMMGRIGGDEFLILMKNTSATSAITTCEALAKSIDDCTFKVLNHSFLVSACFGAVEITPGVNIPDLISTAEQACRQAKADPITGSTSVVFTLGDDAVRRRGEDLALARRLTSELAPAFLDIAMQPILSLQHPKNGLDVEILLRARALDGGVIPPSRIIGVAEAHGKTGVIDRWVMKTALQWLDTNLDYLPLTRFVGVNISAASINDERFMSDLYMMLRDHPNAANHICIELSEGVALADISYTNKVFNRLRDIGVKVALDNFGARYASLRHLDQLRPDVLKIDGALIKAASKDPTRLSLVQSISDLARNLGMRSIAEHVETTTQLTLMANIGIDYVQGFLVAEPQTTREILLAQNAAHWIKDPAVMAALAASGGRQDYMADDDLSYAGAMH